MHLWDVAGGVDVISQAHLLPFFSLHVKRTIGFRQLNYFKWHVCWHEFFIPMQYVNLIITHSISFLFYGYSWCKKLSAVNQPYETRVSDEFVMEGNDAIVKCSLPSFAADFLDVISWSSDKKVYIKKSNFHGNNSPP